MPNGPQIITDPVHFIQALGGLHDVWIERVTVDIERRSLELSTNDLNANFVGLPEDPGRRPCALLFLGVSRFFTSIDIKDGLVVSDAEVTHNDDGFEIAIDLREGAANFAGRSIAFAFDGLAVVD